MTTGEKIIKKAESYKGNTGGFVWNYWPGLGWGSSWCVGFILYVLYKAGLKKHIYNPKNTKLPYWVPTIEEWLHKHATHVKMADAQPGDIVIFTWTGGGNNSRKIGKCSRDHIGFIRKKGTSKVCYTIEGNTSGGKVDERTRALTYIFAIYRLDCCKTKKTTTTKKTETKKKETKKKTTKKTKAQKLNDRAIKDSWAKGTPPSKYHYPTGAPKAQYKKDLDKAYPKRSGWWKQTRAGAACDVFVPVVIRVTGVDKSIPHGLEYMIPYLEKTKKLKIVPSKDGGKKGHYYPPSLLKGGDIVVLKYKGGGAHTFFVVEVKGKKYVAEAQFHGKTWPHISNELTTLYKSKYKMLRVYRAVE